MILRGSGGMGPNEHNRNGALWFGQEWWRHSKPDRRVSVYDRIRHQPHAVGSETLLVACADPNYFFSMGDIYLESIARHSSRSCSVHLVLCDFDQSEEERARLVIESFRDRVVIGTTYIKRHPGVHKDFYCIARFYEMSRLVTEYRDQISASIIFTDIDSVFRVSIPTLSQAIARFPVGYVKNLYLLPWHAYRANMLSLSTDPRHKNEVDAFVTQYDMFLDFISGTKSYWYLDQAAIGQTLMLVSSLQGHAEWAKDITPYYIRASYQVTARSFDAGNKRQRLLEFLEKTSTTGIS